MAADDDDVDSGWDEPTEPMEPGKASVSQAPAAAKPLARRLGEGGQTAKLLADAEIERPKPAPAPATKSATARTAPSIPGPGSRRFTPKVTNAVQQAKELDTGAQKPVTRRPTPMRVPKVSGAVGAAPLLPALPPKPPTTSLRFNEKPTDGFGDFNDLKPGNQRKQTLKLNRAAQDLAVEISNDEADVYSQRMSGEPAAPEPANAENPAPAPEVVQNFRQTIRQAIDPTLDLHLGDIEEPRGRATADMAPTTARSAAPAPAIAPKASPLQPPRAPAISSLAKSAGFRGPPKPKGLSGVTRLDTPSALSKSLPGTGAPTQPPPAAVPTPVPPGFDEESPVITFESEGDVEVSVTESDDIDSLEIGEFEAAEDARSVERPTTPAPIDELDPEAIRGNTKPFEPFRPDIPQPKHAPGSAQPATTRGGTDDDPALAPIRERFERKDYMGALMRAEALLAKSPDHTGAKYFAATCQDRVKEMYISRLGSGASIPRLTMSPDRIQALALDHRSGFLLSLIDGMATVDDVLDISGMPMIEALRLLFELKNEGVIDT